MLRQVSNLDREGQESLMRRFRLGLNLEGIRDEIFNSIGDFYGDHGLC